MVGLKKPEIKAVTVTVVDRKSMKSRSLTVYGGTVQEIFNKVKNALK